VTDVIPENTFIDKRKFPGYDALYEFLKGMTASEYEDYRKAIHEFIHGDNIKRLGAGAFADFIVREVVNDRQAIGR
jgi:hypothetical protein